MSRAPRTHFPGACYHVTSRGNRRAPIFHDARDHLIWLDTLALTAQRHNFEIHAYCMMPNHFHLLLATPYGNLSDGMHQLNAEYCQHFNHRHQLSGHVLQGRFHAVIIEDDQQMLATARYICLNPVRAKLVSDPASWAWSSHQHVLQPEQAPQWLRVESFLAQFGPGKLAHQVAAYKAFVDAGKELKTTQKSIAQRPRYALQRKHPLATFAAQFPDRNEAMAQAHRSGGYTWTEIANHFGVSIRTVARAIRAHSKEEC